MAIIKKPGIFLIRKDTTENWRSSNPVLLDGELGVEISADGSMLKIGDGETAWNELDYLLQPKSFLEPKITEDGNLIFE